jgi:hypothetical protein
MIKTPSLSSLLLTAIAVMSLMCRQHRQCHAFVTRTSQQQAALKPHSLVEDSSLHSPSSTSLGVGDILGNLFGGGSNNDSGPKEIVNLPASVVKVGPLRFFLQIYLVGEQNNPAPGSWAFNNNDAGSLDMYYTDGTGMFSIVLEDYGIKIVRYGQKPSLQYVLQESVMLEGVLKELNSIAFEVDDIEEEKRLLQFGDKDVISKALDSLPARSSSSKKSD